MPLEIDFEGNSATVTPKEGEDKAINAIQQSEKTDINNQPDVVDVNKVPQPQPTDEPAKEDKTENNNEDVIEEGTEVEFEGNTYKVDSKGDLVDASGNVFKTKDELQAWLKENQAINEADLKNEFSIDGIKQTIGINVVDSKGNEVQFDNTPQGVSAYVNSVIEMKSEEIRQGAINKLLDSNPLVRQFIDYVEVNGSAKGFGDIPDRSNIVIEKDNELQQIAIIKMAAEEFGNKSLNDNYIKYLKDSNTLYDEAKAQLQALVGKDKAYQKELERQANEAREQEKLELNQYWEGVSNAINNRVIGNYRLPESFVKDINGKKVTLTPNDFYDYVSLATVEDEFGNKITKYQNDVKKLSNEEMLNKDLLDAWLMYTGGSYKDLINMAVQEDKVKKLIIKSKEQRATKTIKVVKPSSKFDANDVLLD